MTREFTEFLPPITILNIPANQRPVLDPAKGQGPHDAIHPMSHVSSGNCSQTHYSLCAWTGWGLMSFWLPWQCWHNNLRPSQASTQNSWESTANISASIHLPANLFFQCVSCFCSMLGLTHQSHRHHGNEILVALATISPSSELT